MTEEQPSWDDAVGMLEEQIAEQARTIDDYRKEVARLTAARPEQAATTDKYRGTIREALRIAVTAAENDRQAERFEAALAAMDQEG